MIVYVICAFVGLIIKNINYLKVHGRKISESFLQCLFAIIHHCLFLHRSVV